MQLSIFFSKPYFKKLINIFNSSPKYMDPETENFIYFINI